MHPFRLAYLVTHPIQYQAPLLQRISEQPDIDLKVFFCTDFSTGRYKDKGFGREIAWDVPVVNGYRWEVLPALGTNRSLGFLRPLNYGLKRRLKEGNFDALWIHGWGLWSHILAVTTARNLGIKVLIRGEAVPDTELDA